MEERRSAVYPYSGPGAHIQAYQQNHQAYHPVQPYFSRKAFRTPILHSGRSHISSRLSRISNHQSIISLFSSKCSRFRRFRDFLISIHTLRRGLISISRHSFKAFCRNSKKERAD